MSDLDFRVENTNIALLPAGGLAASLTDARNRYC